MKNILSFVIVIFCSFFSNAILPPTKSEAINHLMEINKEWKYHIEAAPNIKIAFQNDIDRISFHLKYVVKDLRSNTSKNFTKEALENRRLLLDKLEYYASSKIFPTNNHHSIRTPYFIDDSGVHCAVGYLIAESGNESLAATISEEHNYDYLADIKTTGVLEWAVNNGFTLKELAWIQPGYMSTQTLSQVGGGTNGPIKFMCKDETNNRLIYTGDFTEIDASSPCNNIGVYENGVLSCLDGGLTGTINHVYEKNGKIYASGNISNGGIQYQQAINDNGVWIYSSIPGRTGAEAVFSFPGENFNREVILRTGNGNNDHEIWRVDDFDNWSLEATFHGKVSSADLNDDKIYYGGNFAYYTAHLTGGDIVNSGLNLISRNINSDTWNSVDGGVADSIHVIKNVNGIIMIGGSDNWSPSSTPNYAISMIHADTTVSISDNFWLTNNTFIQSVTTSVYDLTMIDIDSTVAICGNFSFTDAQLEMGQQAAIIKFTDAENGLPGSNLYGLKNVGTWTTTNLRSIQFMNNKLYFGGNYNYLNMNNISQLDNLVTIDETSSDEASVFPNPSSGVINITGVETHSVRITTIEGKQVFMSNGDVNKISTETIPAGSYILSLNTTSGQIINKKITIQ